ncbi:MAG: hypothetical protein AB7L17_11640 [Ilumatobacteraceae bacterium]
MQLFSRTLMLSGPFSETMAFSTDMRQFVSEQTGRDIGLWSVMFGAPLGTIVYTTHVEGVADLQSIGATLLAHPDYHAKLAKAQQLSGGPPVDQLSTPIHGELGEAPPVGSVAVVTTAAIANGAYADAIGWGVDMAQYVEGVTGFPVAFLIDDYGPFGQVRWISVAPDAAATDTASQKLNADPGYLDKLRAAGQLFAEGSGQRGLAARVA